MEVHQSMQEIDQDNGGLIEGFGHGKMMKKEKGLVAGNHSLKNQLLFEKMLKREIVQMVELQLREPLISKIMKGFGDEILLKSN